MINNSLQIARKCTPKIKYLRNKKNIIKKYNWNDTKELSNKTLFKEFTKSSLINKIIIYRLLITSRRKMLREKWDKIKKEQDINNFLLHAKYVLKGLEDYIFIGETIKESDIKNTYELWLICGIIHDIGLMPLSTENAINEVREKKSFNETKKKMIDYLKEFQKREWGFLSELEQIKNPLIDELEVLEYKELTTKKAWEMQERKRFLSMMNEAGIGKERANRILLSLEKWAKNAPEDRHGICNFTYEMEEEEKELLSKLESIERLLGWKEDDIFVDEVEQPLQILLQEVEKYNINEDNYKDLLSILWVKDKRLNDESFIERTQANNYYKFISDRIFKN